MGLPLKQLAKQVTRLAFNLSSDLVASANYIQPSSTAYNATTGVTTATNVTKAVSAMILAFDEKEIDGHSVKLGDERVLIQYSDLGTLTPGTDDTIVVGTITRRIITIENDGVNALWRFHTRREVAA